MRVWLLTFCLLFPLVASGCGSKESLVDISGTVTLDGKPLDNATLQLDAADGSNPAMIAIAAGKFSGKVTPGPKGVQFFAMRQANESSATLGASPKGGLQAPHQNILPDKYGFESSMKVEISPAGNPDLVFELDSK